MVGLPESFMTKRNKNTFAKRQKEMKRMEKAQEKREKRLAGKKTPDQDAQADPGNVADQSQSIAPDDHALPEA